MDGPIGPIPPFPLEFPLLLMWFHFKFKEFDMKSLADDPAAHRGSAFHTISRFEKQQENLIYSLWGKEGAGKQTWDPGEWKKDTGFESDTTLSVQAGTTETYLSSFHWSVSELLYVKTLFLRGGEGGGLENLYIPTCKGKPANF